MKLKRKIELYLYVLFYYMTFKRFYVCDDCKKIHRYVEGDCFPDCGGEFENKVFVRNECASKTINDTFKMMRNAILK